MLVHLRPALLRGWRGPGRLQIGLDPRRGAVLTHLDAVDEELLERLAAPTDPLELRALAGRLGAGPGRVEHLLQVLDRAGVLVGAPAPAGRGGVPREDRRRLAPDAEVLALGAPDGDGWGALADRGAAAVLVVGASRTGLAIATGLAGAGVGRVGVDDPGPVRWSDVSPGGYSPEDVGQPRERRAAVLVRSRAPATLGTAGAPVPEPGSDRGTARGTGRGPDLVVLTADGAHDPVRADALVRDAVPHLGVLWREDVAVVGPLVLPGASSCLRCADLHRTDRDPEWPRIAAQVGGRPGAGPQRPEEAGLVALVAALAVAQVLVHLGGSAPPAAVDATLEASAVDASVAVRPWSPHPACGCTWGGPADSGAGRGAPGDA